MSSGATITGRDPATGAGIAVTVRDGRITSIADTGSGDGAFLSPGLVDLQVNGYAGLDLNDGNLTARRVLELTRIMASLGVATYLPTLVTGSKERLLDALSVIARARDEDELCARMIPGVHMEGPSIAPEDGPRGAHPQEHVRAPSLEEFAAWQKASGGLVRLVTLAPEYDEAPTYIRSVTAQGVHVALGHSAATPEQVHAAAEAGARLSTHLGNGAAALMPRHPNLIWAQLADDRLTATLIADGHHLPDDTFKTMLRAKGLERALLVSDSVSLAGMEPGIYRQPIGGDVEVRADGRVGIAGTPYLAGAGLPLIANVPIAMRMAGLSLAQALRLATANPGAFVDGRGVIKLGAPADFIRFAVDEQTGKLNLTSTHIHGEEVFSA
ncbi:amidohydrolase family protein [Nitratireductor sp. GISD-1A_MAKvit]|uniref:N-acetylglucosamine-6-phosphate deacetylase n=1 Tax=Nitratireductor sp. GISD-1A_MAKvit TaxID=3234198 RepID=UPI003466B686